MLLNLINNWPALLATLASVAITIVTICTLLSALFAGLAVIANLVLGTAAPQVGKALQWTSALFGHLGGSVHDFFVHLKILPAADGKGGKPSASVAAIAASLCFALVTAFVSFVAGCLSPKEAQVASDVARDVECVFKYDDGQHTALQIAGLCGGMAEQTVVDILSEKHKAESAKLAASHCSAAP